MRLDTDLFVHSSSVSLFVKRDKNRRGVTCVSLPCLVKLLSICKQQFRGNLAWPSIHDKSDMNTRSWDTNTQHATTVFPYKLIRSLAALRSVHTSTRVQGPWTRVVCTKLYASDWLSAAETLLYELLWPKKNFYLYIPTTLVVQAGQSVRRVSVCMSGE